MPWSGSAGSQTFARTDGTRSGTQVWQQADAAGVDIVAPDHDTHDQDVASGLNSALKKDGGNSATSNIPMGGFTLTNIAEATARTQPARFSDLQDGKGVYIPTVGGSANAITLTSGYSVAAYAAGQTFRFIAASTNSGAVTIALDGLAAKDVKVALAALTAGMITAGQMITVTYDGTQFQMQAESPASIGVGSVMAWTTSTIPAGWLECTGAAVSRSTYSALYAAIGTTYGVGDGSTTFNLPDYRGYFLRGQDGGAASDPNAATRTDRGDGTTGDNVGTKQGADYLSHTHTGTTSSNGAHTHTYTRRTGTVGRAGTDSLALTGDTTDNTGSDGAHTHTFTTAAAPTSGGSETRPKNINVKWIILAIPAASVGSIGVDASSVSYTPTGASAVETNVQAKLRLWVDAKDYGVGPAIAAATNTTNLNALIDLLNAAGGGVIQFEAGTYSFAGSGVVIKTGVHLWGKGKAVTILKSTSATDVIRTNNFYTQYATGTISAGDTNRFGIHHLTIDGDRSNKVFSADSQNGLALWGYGYHLSHVHIQNVSGHAARWHWGAAGDFPMESQIENISIDTCGQHGVWFTGPHDSNINHITIVDAGQQTATTYDGLFCDTGGSAYWYNVHPWHRSTTTDRMRYALNASAGGNTFVNSVFEGNGRIYIGGNTNTLIGTQVYAPRSDAVMIQVDGDRHIIKGRVFTNATAPNPIVLEIGPTTGTSECDIELVVNVSATGTTNELVKFTNDEGNTINIRAVGCNHSVAYSGTPDDDTRGRIDQSFPKPFHIDFGRVAKTLTLANGSNNNINIPHSDLFVVSGPSGAFTITGFAEGYLGRCITVRYAGAQACTIANDSGSSSAGNKIKTLTGGDIVITGPFSLQFEYDSANSEWFLVGGSAYGPSSATDGHAALFNGTTGKLLKSAGAAPALVGKQSKFFAASDFIPRLTDGAARGLTETSTNDGMLDTLDFDQTTQEGATLFWKPPKSWNLGTITFIPYWTADAGSASETFELELDAVALSNDDALDASWGTAVGVSDALIATGDLHIGAESSAVTVGGTPAAGDAIMIRIKRDVANDNLAADARLLGVEMFFTTNAGNDA